MIAVALSTELRKKLQVAAEIPRRRGKISYDNRN
jgi:hypothetical protein